MTQAILQANPPACEWEAHDLPGTTPPACLVIAHFHDAAQALAWCAQPQCKPLLRLHALVPPLAVTLLGPTFGVTATDTIADAMEKIAAVWPAAWWAAG